MSTEAGAAPGTGPLPTVADALVESIAPNATANSVVADEDVELSDAVAAAQAGDELAFIRVYRLLQPRLLRYLQVLAGADAEDIASETWVHICRDLHTFRGDGDGFRAWAVTIGRNRALDHFRTDRRRPADPVPTERLIPIAAGTDTANQAMEAISTAEAIALIASLPQDQAEAVMLRAVVGLDAKTAGQVLGKRAGAVRTSSHRGLKTLAARLESGGQR
ncbi:MAG TPA: RNA polymerase sigma factor [Jatrophihabitans sp.]